MFAVKCLLVAMAAVAANAFSLGPSDVVFHLFTRDNPTWSQPILPTVSSIMAADLFSPNRRTVILMHSYNDHSGGNFIAFVVPAYLENENVNVLAVDWSAGSDMYSNALGHAPQVGRVITQFINILQNNFGYSPPNINLVGVGIGGHIMGIAARNIDNFNNVKIPKITAIDPSFIGWTHHPEKLNADDADVVEVLHATAGRLGYDRPLGTIDFYPNGGSAQNGCGNDVECSHIYAYAFYAESLNRDSRPFMGYQCENYAQAMAQQCPRDEDNRRVPFGGHDDKTGVSGVFWFATNPIPPFAMG